MGQSLSVRKLEAWYGSNQTLKGINMEIIPNQVTAIIGPSGCGKSTFVRCINRMHETLPGTKVKGEIILDGESVYDQDPVALRKSVGMVFQKANPFPSMSIYENVVAGLRLNGMKSKQKLQATAEKSLRIADSTAFFLNGELVEHGPTSDIFTNPHDKRTEDYITGRFG